jgi:aspartate aminotransferase-like enzyme
MPRWQFNALMTTRHHTKLFIPGPVEVSAKTLTAFASPMIGHRSSDFVELYQSMQGPLRELFATKQMVLLSTSSAWGVMEAAIRNLVPKRVLCCMCGAFSDKWLDVARRCGREADALQVEWGQPITPALLEAKMRTQEYDAVTLIHNETSVGLVNPLADIAAVVRKFPNVLLIVDAVSSFSAVPIATDELGIDLLLTGSQKALALPPGFSLLTVSDRAYERAAQSADRGYYLDLTEFKRNALENMTPTTPSIGHIYALRSKLDDIFAEGLAKRYARHIETNALVADWVTRRGFGFFAPAGYRSVTLTCVANTREIDVAALVTKLKQRHRLAIDGGYGKLKGRTFRLSNMGDETPETMRELLDALDDCLEK